MAKTKEEAEKEYEKLRMGKLRLGGSASNADDDDEDDDAEYADARDGADSSDDKKEEEKEKLDESVSAEEAGACKERGNTLYKARDFTGAVAEYARAASSAHAPPAARAIYNANLSAAHLALGAHSEAESAASACLLIDDSYRKARERRLSAREALSRWRGAIEDARVLSAPPARIAALERRAKEAEEKQAAEAMDALKGLGNSLLSNFGLSLDSFSAEKDPNTGSYSISMKR